MNGALDLFIKQGVARKGLDARIGADCKFAKYTCTVVLIKGADEKVFTFFCSGLNNTPFFKGELYTNYLNAQMNRGLGKANMSFGFVFNRSGEDFAIREIFSTCTIDPDAVSDIDGKICICSNEADF